MTKPKDPSQRKGKASKLTEADVRTIRNVHADGTQTVREMAQFYGVNAETIRRCLRGETWNDLQMLPYLTEEELAASAAASAEKMQELLRALEARKAAGNEMLKELGGTFTSEAHNFKGDTSQTSNTAKGRLREMGLLKEAK